MSRRIYELLDGREMVVRGEDLGVRISKEECFLPTDEEEMFPDLLALVDSLQQQVSENGMVKNALLEADLLATKKELTERDRTIAKLREVLTFYWKPEKYLADEFLEDGNPRSCPILRDQGKKAEEVLKLFETQGIK